MSFVPTESVEEASSRRGSSSSRPANAPNPVAPVDSAAARRRSTIASAVARETPADAYVSCPDPTRRVYGPPLYGGAVIATSLVTSWSLDPLQLAPIALLGLAYGVRARTLARREQPVAWWRIALFALGLALLLVAVASPVAEVGEKELFSFHMAQHLLI